MCDYGSVHERKAASYPKELTAEDRPEVDGTKAGVRKRPIADLEAELTKLSRPKLADKHPFSSGVFLDTKINPKRVHQPLVFKKDRRS